MGKHDELTGVGLLVRPGRKAKNVLDLIGNTPLLSLERVYRGAGTNLR